MIASSIPALHQLLRRREVQLLLETFTALAPGAGLALARADGTLFVQHGTVPDPWPVLPIREALQAAPHEEAIKSGALSLYPLCAEGEIYGALAVFGAAPEAVLRGATTSLSLLLASALEKRAIARETLDRYREINLLYRTSETIGASLDPEEILRLTLTEAQEAIPMQSGAVLIHDESGGWEVHASMAGEEEAAALREAGRALLEQVLQTGNPDIHILPHESAFPGAALLCAPMKASNHVHGVVLLCRGKELPTFTAGDEKLLMALASQAGISLEKAWLHQQEIKRQLLEEELLIGRQIQLSLLPAHNPQLPGWEFAVYYQAARQVSGDFYDFYELPGTPGNRIGLVIGDVTGKGVPAALVMAFSRAILRTEAMYGRGPGLVLERFNRFLQENNRTRLFLSAIYAILDPNSGLLTWANGGHERPIRVGGRRPGERARGEELLTRGSLLGAFREVNLEERTVQLEPGELVMFTTDGVTEARDETGNLFGEERLQEVLSTLPPGGAEMAIQATIEAVEAFTGSLPQSDDLTILAIYRHE